MLCLLILPEDNSRGEKCLWLCRCEEENQKGIETKGHNSPKWLQTTAAGPAACDKR